MNDIFYVDHMKISYVPELPLYNVDMEISKLHLISGYEYNVPSPQNS